MSAKKSIDVGARVVDRDYRGEIGVVLINHSSKGFEVNVGDRIAQMILEQIKTPEVEEQANLDQTERGGKGFGSTGTKELKNELVQEKSRQKNEFGENEIGTVQGENVKQLVKDTVNDQGVKHAVVKDAGIVKETEGSGAGKADQQSKQQSNFMKIKSETPGHPKLSKLKTMSRVSPQRQIISVKKMKKLVK